MKKRVLAAVLCLALTGVLLPATALAAAPASVRIGTQTYTADAIDAGGTWTLDFRASDALLTLNGATITGGVSADGDLTIELTDGSVNRVTAMAAASKGIEGNLRSARITIGGGGSLTVEGELAGIDSDYVAFRADCGTVNATGTASDSTGITAYGGLTVSGGSITATGGLRGIYTEIDVTISGDTVNAIGTQNDGIGMAALGDANINVSGGDVTATGGLCALSTIRGRLVLSGSYAIDANRVVNVGDAAPGSLWTGTSADAHAALVETYKYVRVFAPAADIPKTGDGSMPLLWAGTALLAGAELAAGRMLTRRKQRNAG